MFLLIALQEVVRPLFGQNIRIFRKGLIITFRGIFMKNTGKNKIKAGISTKLLRVLVPMVAVAIIFIIMFLMLGDRQN